MYLLRQFCSNRVDFFTIHRRHRRKKWWTRILKFELCDFWDFLKFSTRRRPKTKQLTSKIHIRGRRQDWLGRRCRRRECRCSMFLSTVSRSRRKCRFRGRDARGSATSRRRCRRCSSSNDRNRHACPAPSRLPVISDNHATIHSDNNKYCYY